jgi:CRP-like cAMP-binding protein
MQRDIKRPSFDVMNFLIQQNVRWAASNYRDKQVVYSLGDAADSVFYVYKGKVKVTVVSARGKEVVVAIRGPDEFFGEGALTGELLRLATVAAITTCEIARLEKK